MMSHPAPSNSKGQVVDTQLLGAAAVHIKRLPPINSYPLRLGPELAQNRIESKIRSQGREKCTPYVSPQAVIVLAARNEHEQICDEKTADNDCLDRFVPNVSATLALGIVGSGLFKAVPAHGSFSRAPFFKGLPGITVIGRQPTP